MDATYSPLLCRSYALSVSVFTFFSDYLYLDSSASCLWTSRACTACKPSRPAPNFEFELGFCVVCAQIKAIYCKPKLFKRLSSVFIIERIRICILIDDLCKAIINCTSLNTKGNGYHHRIFASEVFFSLSIREKVSHSRWFRSIKIQAAVKVWPYNPFKVCTSRKPKWKTLPYIFLGDFLLAEKSISPHVGAVGVKMNKLKSQLDSFIKIKSCI